MIDFLSPDEWSALRISLIVALYSVVVSLPFAIGAAWLLARGRFFGRGVLDALAHVPLVLPPVVVGYVLLMLFGIRGPLGAFLYQTFGIRLVFTTGGAVLATAVMVFPLMVRAVRLSIEALDLGLDEAARTLGAGPVDRFRTVTLPLMAPGILSGETRTLPLAIYTAIQTPGGDAAAARLATISFVLAVAGLIASEMVARRVRRMLGRVA